MSPAPTPIETLIDHAADLQRQVDQVNGELLILYLCVLALALIAAMLALTQFRAAP